MVGLVRPLAFAGHTVPDQIHVAKCIYDFAADGGAIGDHPLGEVPNGAIILGGFVDVLTTFVTAGADAGTIALMANAANDLVTATAVSNGANLWDAGVHAVVPVFTAATLIKLTAARQIILRSAGQLITAGRLVVYLFYVEPAVIEATA